ncbi:MAG TPA: cation-translocating P-type ATPase, partial [Gemmatimonadales bacterium]|nr:cation-translocating P-type ATPase [Gemmatimonadales bacterium]
MMSPWRTPFAKRTYIAGALWAAGGAAAWLAGAPDQAGWLAIRLDPAGLLYTAASLVGGWNFVGAALRATRTLKLDMNFLMSAAIVGAILIGEPFEAATLAFLFSFAELLERFAVNRGRRSIARLVELAPERADRLLPSGVVETIPIAELRTGDRVRIRPGDKVPADGRVVAGSSAVNEATITGESLPRAKQLGDQVFAGTLNTDGALDIEVTADAAHSTLARIIRLVNEAEARRAPIEQFVQRFARVYTPVVTGGAVLVMVVPPLVLGASGLDWFVRGLTLLVIACPCALVIATPVTVVSALTSAARHGVLIKGGEHLEALGSTRALAVDKTGTLTTGALRVTGFQVADGTPPELLLQRLTTVEARSEHPIAQAIARFAAARGVHPGAQVEQFAAMPGRGIRAKLDGHDIVVGTETFVGPDPASRWGGPEPGTLLIYARTGDGLEGVLTIQDEVRPETRAVLTRLHALGIHPIVMLTGDGAETAELVGHRIGVDAVRARLLPEDKVSAIRALKDLHGSVAMLGDGVNDAPALAEATVGIAMGAAGSPATIETADVALMADDL